MEVDEASAVAGIAALEEAAQPAAYHTSGCRL